MGGGGVALDEIKYVDEQVSGRQHWTSGVGGCWMGSRMRMSS